MNQSVPVWKKPADLAALQQMSQGTADQHLGILLLEVGPDYLIGTVPVDARTRQPFGLLHGGISAVLAESLGSLGGYLSCPPGFVCVGVEINVNHLLPVRSGTVRGEARPLRVGGRIQVWETRLTRDDGELCAISRLTLAVIRGPREQANG